VGKTRDMAFFRQVNHGDKNFARGIVLLSFDNDGVFSVIRRRTPNSRSHSFTWKIHCHTISQNVPSTYTVIL